MTLSPDAFEEEVNKAHQALKIVLEQEHIDDTPHGTLWYETSQDYAHALIDAAYISGYASGLSHKSVAAASYYAACLMANERRTQEKVSDLFGVAKGTIRAHYIELTALLPDAKENTWIRQRE